MDLTVAVVNWNTRDLLRQCLESVYRTDHTDTLRFEVVVVDNGSVDGSAEMVATHFPGTRVIRNEENLGFARAMNQAIRISSGRHVLLLNSDAALGRDAARWMVDFLDKTPDAAAIGGKLLSLDGSFQSSYMDFPSLWDEVALLAGLSRWLFHSTYPSHSEAESRDVVSVDWVSGAFLMVRRLALEHVGLLDEDYFMYSEEMDWCFRAKKNGWQVFYLPDAIATHRSGGTSQRVPLPKRAQLYHSKWLFMQKHRGSFQARSYRLLVRLVSTLKLLAWLSSGLAGDRTRRDRARRNIASYRFLLTSF